MVDVKDRVLESLDKVRAARGEMLLAKEHQKKVEVQAREMRKEADDLDRDAAQTVADANSRYQISLAEWETISREVGTFAYGEAT